MKMQPLETWEKLATSDTLEGITKMIREYFRNPSATVENGVINLLGGPMVNHRVSQKKGRYRFEFRYTRNS